VVLRKGKPKRTVPVSTLIKEKPGKILGKNEIIAEIQVPVYGSDTGTSFCKFAKTANDYALATVATRISLKSGKVAQARIAVNGVTVGPERCEVAEKMLEGKKVTATLIQQAARKVSDSIKFRKDFRASVEYRKEILPVLVRRCLEDALKQAGK
jgi:carbon-monoxide dehydrogenase medium subunit